VNSDDGAVAMAATLTRGVDDHNSDLDGTSLGETDPGGRGMNVVEREATVFLELSRSMTAHPPSSVRGCTRWRAPSERATQARRTDGGRCRRERGL